MHNPELHSLSRVEWQFFCTLTFRSENLTDRVRLSMFFSWLRTSAELSGVHFKRLLWCLRREKGEGTGRLHYHVVIAGLPSSYCNRITCFALMAKWEKLGGGMARITQYVGTLDGIDYILKGAESGSQAARWAGDYHELSKFGESCEVTLSVSAIAYLDQRGLLGRRGKGYELWRQTPRRSIRQSGVSKTSCESVPDPAITGHTSS